HGVNLSGIVATSAVVTAVIGFSLQDTLGNVMGGMALQMERSIGVGDWVRLGDVEGVVREIRWRQTSIETRNWDTVVIPNSVLTTSDVRTRIVFALQRAGISLTIPAQRVFLTMQGRTRSLQKKAEESERRVGALKRIAILEPLTDPERRELAERLTVAPFRRG